jgi:hypothetical protein
MIAGLLDLGQQVTGHQDLAHVEALEADIDVLSERIAELAESRTGQLAILDSITGMRAAEVNPGRDRPGHEQVSHRWATGVVGRPAPGAARVRRERGSATPRKGSPWLADVLTECAWAAVKTKGTYLSAYYVQVMRRQGKQKAIMALTHKILVIAWNLLSTGALYDDPGAAALRKTTDEQLRRRALGDSCDVSVNFMLTPRLARCEAPPQPASNQRRVARS